MKIRFLIVYLVLGILLIAEGVSAQNPIVLECIFKIENEAYQNISGTQLGILAEKNVRAYLNEVSQHPDSKKMTDNIYKNGRVNAKINGNRIDNFNFDHIVREPKAGLRDKYNILSISTDFECVNMVNKTIEIYAIVRDGNSPIPPLTKALSKLNVKVDPSLRSRFKHNYYVLEEFVKNNISSIEIGGKSFFIEDENRIRVDKNLAAKLKEGSVTYSINNNIYYKIRYDVGGFIIGINESKFPIKNLRFSVISYSAKNEKMNQLDGLELYYNNKPILIETKELQRFTSSNGSIFEFPLIQNEGINYSLKLKKNGHKIDEFLTEGNHSRNLAVSQIGITSQSIEISQQAPLLYGLIPMNTTDGTDFINAAISFVSYDESLIVNNVPEAIRLVLPTNKFIDNELTFNPNDSIPYFDKTWEIVNAYENKQQLVFRSDSDEALQYHRIEIKRRGKREKLNLSFSGDIPKNTELQFQINTLDKNAFEKITNYQLNKGLNKWCFLPDNLLTGENSTLTVLKPKGYNVELVGIPSDWKTENKIVVNLEDVKEIGSNQEVNIQLKFTKIEPFVLFYLDVHEVEDLNVLIETISQQVGDKEEGFGIFLSNDSKPEMMKNRPDLLGILFSILRTRDFVVPTADVDTAAFRSFIEGIEFHEEQRDIHLHLVLSKVFYRNFQFEKSDTNEYGSYLGDNAFQYYKNRFINNCLEQLPRDKVKELNIYFGTDLYVERLSKVKTDKDEFYQLIMNQNYLEKKNIKFKKL